MSTTVFIDERLDVEVEQGAQGGPSFLTTVLELAGGGEKRNIEWTRQKLTWDISYGIQSPEELAAVETMFYNCFGRAYGFRFKDWSDYQIGDTDFPSSAAAQAIGTGDGTTTIFQMFKLYATPANTAQFIRKITRPVSTTLLVYDMTAATLLVEGTNYSVNYDTGLITFLSGHIPAAGHNIGIICEFDVPVRFDSDKFIKKVTWAGAEELPTIAIKEIKE